MAARKALMKLLFLKEMTNKLAQRSIFLVRFFHKTLVQDNLTKPAKSYTKENQYFPFLILPYKLDIV